MPSPTPPENSASTAPTATGTASGPARPPRERHSAETHAITEPKSVQTVAVRPFEQRLQRILALVDPGMQVATLGEPGRDGSDRERLRIDGVDLVPGDRRGHRGLRHPAHRVG